MATTDMEVTEKLTPMLAVHDAAAAIDFYIAAFDGVEDSGRYEWEGRIGHAQVRIGDALIMLADEAPGPNQSPRQLGGTSVILHLDVDDTDGVTAQAIAAGAELVRSAQDQPYGRISKIRDPFGHVWMLNGPTKNA